MIGPLIRYLSALAGLSHYDLARPSNATVSQTHVWDGNPHHTDHKLVTSTITL